MFAEINTGGDSKAYFDKLVGENKNFQAKVNAWNTALIVLLTLTSMLKKSSESIR